MGRRDIVAKYITRLEILYKEHSILERFEALVQRIQHAADEEEIQQTFGKLDKLDVKNVNYMIATENFTRKPPPTGIYAWLLTLEKMKRTIT